MFRREVDLLVRRQAEHLVPGFENTQHAIRPVMDRAPRIGEQLVPESIIALDAATRAARNQTWQFTLVNKLRGMIGLAKSARQDNNQSSHSDFPSL